MSKLSDMHEREQMPDETRIRTDGGVTEDEERVVADLELRDGDWLHDGEDDEGDRGEASGDGGAERENDGVEWSEHVEEMARDIATDLFHEHIDGLDKKEANDRSEEVVNEFADEYEINRWDENNLDEFEQWLLNELK